MSGVDGSDREREGGTDVGTSGGDRRDLPRRITSPVSTLFSSSRQQQSQICVRWWSVPLDWRFGVP
nr:hypothetical protein Iba_chr01dCG4000 [Ipomoea batatas]